MPGTFNLITITKGKSIRIYCAPDEAKEEWNTELRDWIIKSPPLAADLYDAGLRLIILTRGTMGEIRKSIWADILTGVIPVVIDESIIDSIDPVDYHMIRLGTSIPDAGLMILHPPFSLETLLHESMHFFLNVENPDHTCEEDVEGNEESYIEKYSSEVAKSLEMHPTLWPLRSQATLLPVLNTLLAEANKETQP